MKRHLEKLKEHSKKVSTKLKEHSKNISIKLKDHSNKLFNSLKSKHVATLVEPITNYKQIFLFAFIAVLLVHLYAVFLKNPFFYPGLEGRTILLLIPLFVLVILFYTPWVKIVSKINGLHLIKRLKLEEKAHSFEHSLQNLSIQTIKEALQKEKVKNFFKYGFLVLLALVTLSSFKFDITNFISEPLLEIQFPLTILTLIFGAITFWQNKSVIEEIEEEQNQEEKEEEKKALEFGGKYPRLAKIPLIGRIAKWGYKEGGIYSISLLVIVSVGSILRFSNIEKSYLNIDESITGLAIKGIIENFLPVMPSGLLYSRELLSLYVLSIGPIFFGRNSFGFTFIPIICGIVSIIICYFISKQYLSKYNSLLLTLIISLLNIFISFSRFNRMYQIFFLFTAILFYLITLYSKSKKSYFLIISFFLSIFVYLTHRIGAILIFLLILFFLFDQREKILNKLFKIKYAIIAIGILVFIVFIWQFNLIIQILNFILAPIKNYNILNITSNLGNSLNLFVGDFSLTMAIIYFLGLFIIIFNRKLLHLNKFVILILFGLVVPISIDLIIYSQGFLYRSRYIYFIILYVLLIGFIFIQFYSKKDFYAKLIFILIIFGSIALQTPLINNEIKLESSDEINIAPDNLSKINLFKNYTIVANPTETFAIYFDKTPEYWLISHKKHINLYQESGHPYTKSKLLSTKEELILLEQTSNILIYVDKTQWRWVNKDIKNYVYKTYTKIDISPAIDVYKKDNLS